MIKDLKFFLLLSRCLIAGAIAIWQDYCEVNQPVKWSMSWQSNIKNLNQPNHFGTVSCSAVRRQM